LGGLVDRRRCRWLRLLGDRGIDRGHEKRSDYEQNATMRLKVFESTHAHPVSY
jgi:hypothetical protein